MRETITLKKQSAVKMFHTPFNVNSLDELGEETCGRPTDITFQLLLEFTYRGQETHKMMYQE
jgi:hypothetical protein